MSANYPPCRCGATADRLIAAEAFCSWCAENILEPIRERVILREGLQGVGVRVGIDRPSHGPGACDLRCTSCGATWVARVGCECPYCELAADRMIAWQRELLLRPELPDVADRRYDKALEAWAERLARGVEADIINEYQARAAWDREVGYVAA